VKRADVIDSSDSQVLTVGDHFDFMENVVIDDFSSQIYGGSPLFVPTPPGSPPFDSIAVCSEPL